MLAPSRRFWAASQVQRHGAELILLILLAAALELAAGAGLAYVAGLSAVRNVLGGFDWRWLVLLAGALVVSFAGYYLAYYGIFGVEEGPRLPARQMRAVVVAGFGGLLAHGGIGGVDKNALESAGADEKDAKARAAALGGLEYGMLALAGCGAAIAVLTSGRAVPPDVTLPWAIIPVPAMLAGFWLAGRYWRRFYGRGGWRGTLGIFLRSAYLVRETFLRPWPWGLTLLGMALFWAGDAFAVWAGLAAFGFPMSPAALIVAFATGMVFTRRTGPLAGAGILALVLPVCLWYCGAPLAVAVAGVFAYRILVLWLPMPVSLASLPVLRTMIERRIAQAEGTDPGRYSRCVSRPDEPGSTRGPDTAAPDPEQPRQAAR